VTHRSYLLLTTSQSNGRDLCHAILWGWRAIRAEFGEAALRSAPKDIAARLDRTIITAVTEAAEAGLRGQGLLLAAVAKLDHMATQAKGH
jgi:hypothetical protein